MDKKAKKRVQVLRQKLAKLQQQLSGAKQQMDDPEEVPRIEKEIEDAKTEMAKLKDS